MNHMWNLKIQQTSEYNKKEADLQIQRTNYLLPVRGRQEQQRGRGLTGTNYWVKIGYKYVLFSTRNIANIL